MSSSEYPLTTVGEERSEPNLRKPILSQSASSVVHRMRRRNNNTIQEQRRTEKPVEITVTEYNKTFVNQYSVKNISEISRQEKEGTIRWINCEGRNTEFLTQLGKTFNVHEIAIEDMMEIPQRPKLDIYDNYCLIIFQIMTIRLPKENEPLRQQTYSEREQVSMLVFKNTVITLQEGLEGDCWGRLRESFSNERSKIRTNDAEFLVYSLVDALIDSLFPLMTLYGELLEDAEITLLENPNNREEFLHVGRIDRELRQVRRLVKPIEQIVESMIKPIDKWGEETQTNAFLFSFATREYIRDVASNVDRIVDMLDAYKELCGSVTGIYSSEQDHRNNQTMYALSIISAIFLPLTFVAGVYGMNWVVFPELQWKLGYLYFWILSLTIVLLSLGILRWKRVI